MYQYFRYSLQCVLTIFIFLPIPPRPNPFLTIKLYIIYFIKPTKFNLCSPPILECGMIPWSMVDLWRDTELKKTDFTFPRSYQWPGTPQTEVDLHACLSSPHCDLAWLEHSQVLCMLSQLLWVHVYGCVQETLFPCSHLLPWPLPHFMPPLPWVIKTSHWWLSILQYPVLCILPVVVSVLTTINYK